MDANEIQNEEKMFKSRALRSPSETASEAALNIVNSSHHLEISLIFRH
jgi:hypothetical protein